VTSSVPPTGSIINSISAELYKAIYHYVLSRPGVAELTVEDPAEAFEDLRDKSDLKMLLSNEQFMEEGFGEGSISYGGGKVSKKAGKAKRQAARGKLDPPANKAWVEKWRTNLKIAGVCPRPTISRVELTNVLAGVISANSTALLKCSFC
jgi:hypothetical protein